MEIEEALEQARTWLRSQSWWSETEDAIISVARDKGSWVVNHASREYVLTGDELAMRIGGFGPVVVWDDGRILPPNPSANYRRHPNRW